MNQDSIYALRNEISSILTARHDLARQRDEKGRELAVLLCPFAIGETVYIPNPAQYSWHECGTVWDIRLNLDYGYEFRLSYDGTGCAVDRVSAFQNVDFERRNDKTPVLYPRGMAELLSPFKTPLVGFYS